MQERMKVPDFVDIGVIIGAGGATVRRIEEETETRIFHRRGSFTFEVRKMQDCSLKFFSNF